MKCRKCGKEINNEEKFCSSCGEPVNNNETNNTTSVNKEDNKKGNNKVIVAVLIIALIIIIGLIVKTVVNFNSKIAEETSDNEIEENINDTSDYNENKKDELIDIKLENPSTDIPSNIDFPDNTYIYGHTWYTFNNEYIVQLHKYYYIDAFTVFDLSGNQIFDLSDSYQNTDSIEINIDNNEITYKVNCDERYIDYYNHTTATFGKLKYNTKTKQFVKEEETKSIDYCS